MKDEEIIRIVNERCGGIWSIQTRTDIGEGYELMVLTDGRRYTYVAAYGDYVLQKNLDNTMWEDFRRTGYSFNTSGALVAHLKLVVETPCGLPIYKKQMAFAHVREMFI